MRILPTKPLAALALTLTLLGVAACDQLTATVQAVSALTRTPDLANSQGMDSQLTQILPLDQLETTKGVGVITALGQKESVTSTAPPAPITGALVRVEWTDTQSGHKVSLCESAEAGAEGTYHATNVPSDKKCGDPLLDYVDNTKYTTTIETASDLYTLSVTAPPAIDAANVTFTPALSPAAPVSMGSDLIGVSLPSHSKSSALTIDWSADAAASDRHAFLVVIRINFVGDATVAQSALQAANWQADPQNPVYDNAPRDPSGFIQLVTATPATSEEIPATTFDTTGLYIVLLTPVELSTEKSSNLALLGSAALAGVGTSFVMWVD